MSESAFRIWLHPVRTLRELSAARTEAEELRRLCAERAEELAKAQENIDSMRHSISMLRRRSDDLQQEVSRLDALNRTQAVSIEEWERASAEMEKVASQLEKLSALREQMNRMRDEYEAKIEKLEKQLWWSRSGRLRCAKGREPLPDPSESELLEPGESPFAAPEPIAMNRYPTPRRSADDTDWLLPLPESE